MAFAIKIKSHIDPCRVRMAVWERLEKSRFKVAAIRNAPLKRADKAAGVQAILTFHEIRLRKSKFYCGSHPAACEAKEEPKRRMFGGKHIYLEGADWIGWNDLCNDALDALEVDADAGSPVCEIRRGRCRRVRYDFHEEVKTYEDFLGKSEKQTNEWDRIGGPDDYADHCGKAPPVTVYPEGTPGVALWRADDEATNACVAPAGRAPQAGD